MITASLPVQTSRATLFWPLSSTQLLCPRGCHSLWCEHHLEVLTYFLHIYVFSLRHREEYRPSQWWCVWECVWSVKYCSWWLSNVSASTWSLSLLWLSHASGKASLCCVPKEEEKWKIKHKTSFFTNLITVASGGDQSWISLLCTKACSIVCYTMPGIVRRSTAALLRESSQRVATMAIHMADLIAVRERSLPTVMLENRSCSRSSYLADGCWQPTQPLCASLLFLFHLIIFYFLFPTFPPPVALFFSHYFPHLRPHLRSHLEGKSVLNVLTSLMNSLLLPIVFDITFYLTCTAEVPSPAHLTHYFTAVLIPYFSVFQQSPSPCSCIHTPHSLISAVTAGLKAALKGARCFHCLILRKIADPTDAILSLSCILSLLFLTTENWQPHSRESRETWKMHSLSYNQTFSSWFWLWNQHN